MARQLSALARMRKVALQTQRHQHASERKELTAHQKRERTALVHAQRAKRKELSARQKRQMAEFIVDQKRELKAKRAHQVIERAEQRKLQAHERKQTQAAFRAPKAAKRMSTKRYAQEAFEEEYEG